MQKRMKKIFSICMAGLIFTTSIPVQNIYAAQNATITKKTESEAVAASNFEETAVFEGVWGDNATWTFSEGTLTISGTGELKGQLITVLPADARTGIKKIIINEGITSLESRTERQGIFHACDAMETIVLPDSLETIGDYALAWCRSLKNIEFGNGLKHIGKEAFTVSKLSEIVLPEGLESIGEWAFREITTLTSVTMPDTVTSLGANAFGNCMNLTSVKLSSSLTSIEESTFYGTRLSNIELPDGITHIGPYAFAGCEFTSMVLPDTVSTIGTHAFANCTNMETLKLPKTAIEIGEGAFKNCSSITNIEIPYGVTAIADSTFEKCTSLTSITMPDTLNTIGKRAFYECESLESAEIPSKSYREWCFQWLFFY